MKFKPQATGYKTYHWNISSEDYRTAGPVVKDTYKQLMKEVRKMLFSGEAEKVSVNRSRRGEWGEWFEHWVKSGHTIKKEKEGWM